MADKQTNSAKMTYFLLTKCIRRYV